MRTRTLTGFFAILLSFCARPAFAQNKDSGQQLKVRCLAGLPNIKHNAGGYLSIQDAALHFDAGKHRAAVSASSIEDIFTGSEVTDAGGMLGEAAKGAAAAAPYDSGAALTLLLRIKVDVLTVTYRDSNGGLHAAIFALPKNRASQFRADLIAQGAHANSSAVAHVSPMPDPRTPSADAPIGHASGPADRSKPAVIVEPVGAADVRIPAAFRMAIYEDVVERFQRSGLFSQVYRSGDRSAESNPDALTIRAEVEKFKEGSQTARELTIFLGQTKVTLDVKLARRDGTNIVNQKVEGRVLFFGENLGVTHDVAKRILKILRKNPEILRVSPAA
jgi:hypothetical protein